MERKFCGGFQCASGGVPKEEDVDFCFRAHHSLPWVTMGHMSHHNLPYQNHPFRDVVAGHDCRDSGLGWLLGHPLANRHAFIKAAEGSLVEGVLLPEFGDVGHERPRDVTKLSPRGKALWARSSCSTLS